MRWNGTSLEVLNETNMWVASNLIGATPLHEYNKTQIRFQTSATTWGEWKELMPDHEWNITDTKKEIRLKKPDGTYGDFIDLSSYNYFFTDEQIGETKDYSYSNIPTNYLKLDGSTITRTNYPEFFLFLEAEGVITSLDTEHTLAIVEGKITRVRTNRESLYSVIDNHIVPSVNNMLPRYVNSVYNYVDSTPIGFVSASAANYIPAGWLECNGTLLSRTLFADLFAIIGTTYGAGDGANTFALPDYRGEFLRGHDNGRGVDSSRSFGSTQGDAIRNITGTVRVTAFTNGTGLVSSSGAFTTSAVGNSAHSGGGGCANSYATYTLNASNVVPTAAENRPRNMSVKYLIKYKLGDGRTF